jgi:hypothetical protein
MVTASLALFLALVQSQEPAGAAAVMESLLFGFEIGPAERTADLPADVQQSLISYRQRERAFRPTMTRPANLDGPEGSLYWKRVGLERAIFSLIDRPDSLQLAEEYATQAALFYEWEGFADGPLAEAASADAFLSQHGDSPLAPYVRLFAGHRKLCAVSVFEGLDPRRDKGMRISLEAESQLAAALTGGHPLVRVVADYLLTTRKCFER